MSVILLSNTKTEIFNGFDGLKEYMKERLMVPIFEKIDGADTRDKRKHEIFRVLEEEIPEIPPEHKHLLAELEELYILGILPICDSSYIINNINTIINN